MSGRVAPFSTALVALAALIATVPARAAPSHCVLSDSTYRLASNFGPDTLLVRELVFDSPILAAEVDSSSGTLLIAIGRAGDERSTDTRSLFREEIRSHRVVAYDLHARRVIWDDVSKAAPIVAVAGRAVILEGDHQLDLIRLPDGRRLASLEGEPFLWQDGASLRVTDGAISRWDLEDAHELWRADREVGGVLDAVIRRDSVAYLIADGIQKLDLRQGSLWSYSARASRSGIYSQPGGGTYQMRTLFGGDRAVNMAARPLIEDPDVFFAAETSVVRLDSRTGMVRWRQQLHRVRGFSLKQRALGTPVTQEFLGRLLLRDAGANVAVASLGWASGPKSSWIADPPSLALLSKSDGRVLARVQVPGVQFLSDAWSTPHRHYLMGADRVIAMDDDLNVRATFRAPPDLQPLGAFIEMGELVVATTGAGIAALSADSLRMVWSHRCGRMLAIERELDWSGARYIVTTQGLLRLDAGAGRRPSAYYPLRATWAKFEGSGVMMGADARLRMVILPEPSRTPPRAD